MWAPAAQCALFFLILLLLLTSQLRRVWQESQPLPSTARCPQCSPSHVPHDVTPLEPSSTGEEGTMIQGDTSVG